MNFPPEKAGGLLANLVDDRSITVSETPDVFGSMRITEASIRCPDGLQVLHCIINSPALL